MVQCCRRTRRCRSRDLSGAYGGKNDARRNSETRGVGQRLDGSSRQKLEGLIHISGSHVSTVSRVKSRRPRGGVFLWPHLAVSRQSPIPESGRLGGWLKQLAAIQEKQKAPLAGPFRIGWGRGIESGLRPSSPTCACGAALVEQGSKIQPSPVLENERAPQGGPFIFLAGGEGFEPPLAESESAVLPLDDPPNSG